MIDPLTVMIVGAGALVFREMNRKDYGVLTPSRDERYRNVMEYCHQPELLLEESRLFHEYGLKAQAAMLKRRAEWRARSPEQKTAHEEIYQKALKSDNIQAILEVANAFEGWTATKKASNLREHVRDIQDMLSQDIAKRAAEAAEAAEEKRQTEIKEKKNNGAGASPKPFTDTVIEVDSMESDI